MGGGADAGGGGAEAADEGRLFRGRRGSHFFTFQAGEDKKIQGITGPRFEFHSGQRGAGGRLEGPMGFVFGALRDPAPDQFLLGFAECLVGGGGRHEVIGILGEEPFDDCALVGLAGDDGKLPGLGRLQRLVAPVETEVGFARGGVRTVAVEAVLREERTDVAIIVQRFRGPRGGERPRRDQGCQKEQRLAR